jgi:hypothetical protein
METALPTTATEFGAAGTIDRRASRAVLIDLSGTGDRLAELTAALTDPGAGGWPADRVSVLAAPTDPVALGSRLQALADSAEDALLLHVVGRGFLDERSAPWFELGPERALLPYAVLRRALERSGARRKALLLDLHCGGPADGVAVADAVAVPGVTAVVSVTWDGAPRTASQGAAGSASVRAAGAVSAAGAGGFGAHLVDVIRAGRPRGSAALTLQEVHSLLQGRLMRARLPMAYLRSSDAAGLFPLAGNAGLGSGAAGSGAAGADAENLLMVVWRNAADLRSGPEHQLESDRKWWPIARSRIPGLKAIVFVTGGEVSCVREVFGVDDEEVRGWSKLALLVSPPLSAREIARRLPGCPLVPGSREPAVQGRLREYRSFRAC